MFKNKELDDDDDDEQEEELDELEQQEQIHEDEKEVDETRCKRCLIDFEHINILKSHLMFDLCGRTTATPTTKSSSTTITTATTMPMTTTPTNNYLDWSRFYLFCLFNRLILYFIFYFYF